MQLSEQEIDAERRRLPGTIQRVAQASAMGAIAMFLFGSIFVAAGTAIALVGLKIIPVDEEGVHAPDSSG